ncbi:MAG: hypothetical protein ACXWPM_13030 [Bdellovibrionota bacterium]
MSDFRFLIAAMGLIFALSCTPKPVASNDPKARLQDYISQSFAIKSAGDRGELMNYLTGEARRRLEAWSEEQFREAFIESKRQFVKLAFREVKPVSPTEMKITYELTYVDQGRGHDAKVTNKKLCQMDLVNGKWLIADVQNIKELVEYQNELSLP